MGADLQSIARRFSCESIGQICGAVGNHYPSGSGFAGRQALPLGDAKIPHFRKSNSCSGQTMHCGHLMAGFVEISATIHRACAAFCLFAHNTLINFEPFTPYAVMRRYVKLEVAALWFRTGLLFLQCSFWARLWCCSCVQGRTTKCLPALVKRPARGNRHTYNFGDRLTGAASAVAP